MNPQTGHLYSIFQIIKSDWPKAVDLFSYTIEKLQIKDKRVYGKAEHLALI